MPISFDAKMLFVVSCFTIMILLCCIGLIDIVTGAEYFRYIY